MFNHTLRYELMFCCVFCFYSWLNGQLLDTCMGSLTLDVLLQYKIKKNS